MQVAVLDYGFGNVRSAVRALERVGAEVCLTRDRKEALDASGLVVPGVGAFAACMRGLESVDGPRIIDSRLAGGRPVLGICVGMQILFEHGDEHGTATDGCGQWPGRVQRLEQAPVLPHIGWNTVRAPVNSALFSGIEDERFYFVHSYAVTNWQWQDPQHDGGPVTAPQVTWSHYGQDFVAAVENGPLSATQFHPEKSGDAGLQLLSNWLDTVR